MKNLSGRFLSSQIGLLCLLLALTVVGCTVVGKNLSPERQIRFSESGSGKGEYKYGHLKVGYQYVVKGADLHLSGTIDYTTGFDSLDVRVILFDAGGVVLQQKLIFASGFKTRSKPRGTQSFEEVVPISAGAAGLSFASVSKDPMTRP
jgi:hypothetical protein